MSDQPDHVFGYGSLVLCDLLAEFLGRPLDSGDGPCRLEGYRRTWNVAMDNRVRLPDYKFYLDPVTGQAPGVFVAYLNVMPAVGRRVNGLVIRVDQDQLERLDRRERNYYRIDVTDKIDVFRPGRVWVYVGKPEGVARYEEGLRTGTLVVTRGYLDLVDEAFAALGEAQLAEYRDTTDPMPGPVVDLELHR